MSPPCAGSFAFTQVATVSEQLYGTTVNRSVSSAAHHTVEEIGGDYAQLSAIGAAVVLKTCPHFQLAGDSATSPFLAAGSNFIGSRSPSLKHGCR